MQGTRVSHEMPPISAREDFNEKLENWKKQEAEEAQRPTDVKTGRRRRGMLRKGINQERAFIKESLDESVTKCRPDRCEK